MKITRVSKFPLSECKVDTRKVDRADLAESLQKHVAGHGRKYSEEARIRTEAAGRVYTRTRFGAGSVSFTDFDIVEVRRDNTWKWARRDIAIFTFERENNLYANRTEHVFNVFVDPAAGESARRHGGPNGGRGGIELDAADTELLNGMIEAWIDENLDFVERQERWYRERPWEKLEVGMTLEEAVEKLTSLGWGPEPSTPNQF